MSAHHDSPSRPSGADGLLEVLAWLVPIGVFVQAVLAGQAWFVTPSLIGLHGGIGHGVLLLAVVTAALAWYRRVGVLTAALASVAVAALIMQTGLGYVGRRSGVALASSLHVPLGVAILGATLTVALSLTLSRHHSACAPSADAGSSRGGPGSDHAG